MTNLTDVLISLLTLTILEIILGIDNLVFLSIVSQKLPASQQALARRIGLSLAWIMRLVLLAFAVWLIGLSKPIFTVYGYGISWRDIFLVGGGLFLLVKATQEIHIEMEVEKKILSSGKKLASFFWVISQIVCLDMVFSLDSILTAIGLTNRFWLMATAITIAILVMLFASEPLSRFINRHSTVKMLALSFLMLIGMMLLTEGFGFHIPRGYIYFAMAFSLFVEFLNIITRKKSQ
jgi:predicted tellurium resistance membrane protein TerC